MKLNRRQRALLLLIFSTALLAAVTVAGRLLAADALVSDFARKDLAPCAAYPFGTDWMGRDMFARTLSGLATSILIGLLTAGVSAVVALTLGAAAATLGRRADALVGWCVDLVMGIPHILLLLLISLACGKGFWGVVVGVSLTHWTSLCRLLRGELLQLRESVYIQAARKLGVGRLRVVTRHMLPHLLPQFVTGLILLFPHAILHEASVTFLGFGLSPESPAIGIILSESMRYLVLGRWWLALFPGLSLVGVVLLFSVVGETLQKLWDPNSVHE